MLNSLCIIPTCCQSGSTPSKLLVHCWWKYSTKLGVLTSGPSMIALIVSHWGKCTPFNTVRLLGVLHWPDQILGPCSASFKSKPHNISKQLTNKRHFSTCGTVTVANNIIYSDNPSNTEHYKNESRVNMVLNSQGLGNLNFVFDFMLCI